MQKISNNDLVHYGMPRRSGRYPWGSGDRPYQSVKDSLKGNRRDPNYFQQERTIPKGTKMFRTTVNSKGDLNNKSTYVTYLQADRDLYKGGWVRSQGNSDKAYEIQMTLKEDLKIPSREIYKKALNESLKDKKYLKESVTNYINMIYPPDSYKRMLVDDQLSKMNMDWGSFSDKMIKKYGNMSIDEKWSTMSMTLGLSNGLKEKVISILKTNGYNAMVDEAGVGGTESQVIEGIDPLIIFDSNILEVNKISEISRKDENKANREHIKWATKARSKNKWK